ncbi:MAG: DUF3389 family protein [Vibrio sp.]
MIIEFSQGRIVVTPHEIEVRLFSISPYLAQAKDSLNQLGNSVVMRSHVDAIQLIGRDANIVTAHDVQCQWSIKLDSLEQLTDLSTFLSIPII